MRCALTVVLVVASVAAARADQRVDLDLNVITHATLDAAKVETALHTAETVLATANVRVRWRVCAGDACAATDDGSRRITVLLLPITKTLNPTTSGEVTRDSVTRIPTVLVYVPRNDDVTWHIRHSNKGRSVPELSTVTIGHVVGLTIAHEIGHALGLQHQRSGPMKAEFGPDDLIALRRAKLRFRSGETATMRQVLSLSGDAVPVNARGR